MNSATATYHTPTTYENLVDYYHSELYNFALTLTDNKDEAHDLVDDTFFFHLHNFAIISDKASLGSHLYDVLSRLHSFLCFEKNDASNMANQFLADIENGEEFLNDDIEKSPLSEDCLGKIDYSHRVLLLLHYSDKHSLKDIAESIGTSVNMTSTMINTSKYLLKKQFVLPMSKFTTAAAVPRVSIVATPEDKISA